MGRKVKERRLAVWMNGELAGWWSLTQKGFQKMVGDGGRLKKTF